MTEYRGLWECLFQWAVSICKVLKTVLGTQVPLAKIDDDGVLSYYHNGHHGHLHRHQKLRWCHCHLHHRRLPCAMAQPRWLNILHPLLMGLRLTRENPICNHPPCRHSPYPAKEIKLAYLFPTQINFLNLPPPPKNKVLEDLLVLNLVVFYWLQGERGDNRVEDRMDQIRICGQLLAGRIQLDENHHSVIIMDYPKWS